MLACKALVVGVAAGFCKFVLFYIGTIKPRRSFHCSFPLFLLIKIAPIKFVLVFVISKHHIVVEKYICSFYLAKEGSNGNIHLVSYNVMAAVVMFVNRLNTIDANTLVNIFQLGSDLFLHFVLHCSFPLSLSQPYDYIISNLIYFVYQFYVNSYQV